MRSDLPNFAFVGGAGAGKSTCADYLVEHQGYVRLSFAAPLKDVARQLWGEDRGAERDRLQRLGVGVREIDPDTWVDLLTARVEARPSVRFVVDDCRFPNEYQELRALGFRFVRVEAYATDRLLRLQKSGKHTTAEQLMHESEQHHADFDVDYTIFNEEGQRQDTVLQIIEILNKEAART